MTVAIRVAASVEYSNWFGLESAASKIGGRGQGPISSGEWRGRFHWRNDLCGPSRVVSHFGQRRNCFGFVPNQIDANYDAAVRQFMFIPIVVDIDQ